MLRHRKIGYVALNVTDLEQSCRFYQDVVGLQPNGRGPKGEAFFRFDAGHHGVVLCQAKEAGFKRFGWELESEAQFDELAKALAPRGITLKEVDRTECEALGQARTVRFADPFSGFAWEFYASMRQEPTPFKPTHCTFDRLGHVVLKTARFEEALAFYETVLNFRLSDKVEGVIAFLRAFPNKYHHTFALARGDKPGLHHVNFMLGSIDDWGRCHSRFLKQKVEIVWGPGRHTNAGTYFMYYLDPDGLTLEYGYGMEEFPEVGARPANVRPPGHDSVDLWDSPIDPKTCASGGVEVAAL